MPDPCYAFSSGLECSREHESLVYQALAQIVGVHRMSSWVASNICQLLDLIVLVSGYLAPKIKYYNHMTYFFVKSLLFFFSV